METKQTILACETLRDELQCAMRLENISGQIIWIESALHNFPNKLREQLQAALDSSHGINRVISTFGLCGNALIGVKTGNFELVVPRVDDCISLLFGSVAKRLTYTECKSTYFLTKGWLKGERNIWAEYQYAVEKYGEETADEIMSAMIGEYKYLGILDTDSYDLHAILPETEMIAEKLGLEHLVIPASVEYLRQLLTGPWTDDKFLLVPGNTEIKSMDLY